MTVKAWLEGHDFDLEHLAALLPEGDPRVIQEGDAYYLTSSEIDNPPDGLRFYETASQVVVLVNGLGRTSAPDFRPVKLSGRYEDGGHQHVVVCVDTIEARSSLRAIADIVGSGDASAVHLSPAGPRLTSILPAQRDPDVKEVLMIMGQPESLGWVQLWKVYEIVRASVTQKRIEHLGWTAAKHSAFRASANRPDISGASARHARMGGPPPNRSVTLEEGRQLIRTLVTAWMSAVR